MGTAARVLVHVALWRGKEQLPLSLDMYVGLQNMFRNNLKLNLHR